MLYYGRESYRRNSILICYNFFKNILLVLPQFWFGFLSGFSGQNIYNVFLYQLYNILHASMPIVVYGLLDKEYSGNFLMQNPLLYVQGVQNKLFNSRIFWIWIFTGIWQSFFITIPTYYAFENVILDGKFGFEMIFWGCGMAVYGYVIIITNFKVLIFSSTHSFLSIIVIVISTASYYFLYGMTSKWVPYFSDFGSASM